MEIVEQSTDRLVLRRRQPAMTAALMIFTALSAVMTFNLALQGLARLGTLAGINLIAWLAWLSVAATLTVLGVFGVRVALAGMTCTLDRTLAQVMLRRARGLRLDVESWSIYAISRMEIETNLELRAVGVFLVLRDQTRIALASLPMLDQDAAESLRRTVNAFLHDG